MQQEIPLTSSVAEQDIAGADLLINVFPRAALGGKYPFTLVHTPGLAFLLELPTFPIIGLLKDKNNEIGYAVTPSRVYSIKPDGTFSELGDVVLSGRVSMADNGIQIVMVDGKNGYYYDRNTGLVSKITDPAFYPCHTVTFQDGFFIFERTGTGQFFTSGLLSVTFDPLDFATAEGQPDNLVAVLSDHRELLLVGTDTIEPWYNSGAADFPWERNQGAFIEKGCAARHSIVKQDNTVYFIGSDFMVYKMSGYSPARISTHAVEETLRGVDLTDAFAYSYNSGGQLFYVLTIPSRNITWCYDISTQSWHIRRGYQFGRHQSNNAIFLNKKTLVGDFQNGRIYELSDSYYKDDGEPTVREFVLPTLNNGREFLTVDSLEFDMNSGVGLVNGEGEDPEIRVYFSKDGGENYSQNAKIGKIGKIGKKNTRARVTRFGAARQFVFKAIISDPIPIDIGGAWVEVS